MATTTQVHLEKRSATLWQVTLNNPPINLIDPETVRGTRSDRHSAGN